LAFAEDAAFFLLRLFFLALDSEELLLLLLLLLWLSAVGVWLLHSMKAASSGSREACREGSTAANHCKSTAIVLPKGYAVSAARKEPSTQAA
jgi:hypothetical protein